jgi:hypothetical protein
MKSPLHTYARNLARMSARLSPLDSSLSVGTERKQLSCLKSRMIKVEILANIIINRYLREKSHEIRDSLIRIESKRHEAFKFCFWIHSSSFRSIDQHVEGPSTDKSR